jgi:hypothetical protein
VLASGYGIHSSDNLYSVNTATGETQIPENDFSTVAGQCVHYKNRKCSIKDVINLPVNFNMNQENEKPTDTTESQPHLELADNVMENFILENWDIPAEVIKQKTTSGLSAGEGEKKSTHAETVGLQPANSDMWYGACLGRREKKDNDNDEQVKQEPASGGTWFGPRLGRRDKKSSVNYENVKQEPASGGTWFGPRLGRRDKKSSVNYENAKQEPASGGTWFGPRLGRRDKKSSVNYENAKQEPASGGIWFGPRLGRRDKKSNINSGQMKQERANGGVWF